MGTLGSFLLGGEKPGLPQGNKLCGADTFGKQVVFLECICTDVLLIKALRGCLVMHFLGLQIKPTHAHVCFRPSLILLSCGIPCDIAQNALRLSVGRDTTRADVDLVVQDLVQAVAQLGKDQAS